MGVGGREEAAASGRRVGLRGRGVPKGGSLLLVFLFPQGCAQVAEGSAAQGTAEAVVGVTLEGERKFEKITSSRLVQTSPP